MMNVNECKCDFWMQMCQDTGGGRACDYAAEFCCGDYYAESMDGTGSSPMNSPACYCDFFNYAQHEFDHILKPIQTNKFANACLQFDEALSLLGSRDNVDELNSLKTIYENTNGQNWMNSVHPPHSQWYGISCNDDGYVTGIDLRGNNLQGQFPVYSRNATFSWGGLAPDGASLDEANTTISLTLEVLLLAAPSIALRIALEALLPFPAPSTDRTPRVIRKMAQMCYDSA